MPKKDEVNTLFSKRSQYHDISIEEQDGVRCMRFGGRLQSAIDVETLSCTRAPAVAYQHLPLAFVPHAANALIIGLGGGNLPSQMLRDYPDLSIDVVEIDSQVIELARKYFALPDDERLRVIEAEGREYLRNTDLQYDIIILDALFESFTPFAFVTREFYELVTQRLTPDGVFVHNIVGYLEGPESESFWRVMRGLHDEFASTFLFSVRSSRNRDVGRRNFVVVASKYARIVESVLHSIETRAGGLVRVPGFDSFGEDLVDMNRDFSVISSFSDAERPIDGLLRS